ncbi:trimeric intracellular cation channel family protein [Leucobacter sp. GX24907]
MLSAERLRKNGWVLTDAFTIPLSVDLVAVGVGSLQGAMFAAGFKRIDLLGVALIGIVCGFGGGILRDILLGLRPGPFSDNLYLVVAVGAAILGMLLARALQRVDPLVTALDALSLGIFAAIGTTKALALGMPIAPALFIGIIAAVGGGALRDLLLNLPIAVMHVGSFYAVAALVGVSVLTGLLLFDVQVGIAGLVCVIVTAAMRLLSVKFGWSLPEQRALSRIQRRRQRQVEAAIDEALATGVIHLDHLGEPSIESDDPDERRRRAGEDDDGA